MAEIRDWIVNDPFSASHLNQPLPTVRSVESITGTGGVTVTQGTNGTAITGPGGQPPLAHYLGYVVNAGPKGEADSTDERYWVQLAYIVSGSVYDRITYSKVYPQSLTGDQAYYGQPTTIVRVTNLPERSGGTHTLNTTGTQPVHVFVFGDSGTSVGGVYVSTDRYVMSEGGPLPTGNVTGNTIGNITLTGGTYAATMYGGAPLSIDPTTGNFTMPTTGETNGNSTIIIQNDPEAGLGTHWIGPGATVPLLPTGGTAKIGNTTYPVYRTTAQPPIPQLAVIVCTGVCDGEPANDFADNRYWGRTVQVTNSGGSDCDPLQVGFYSDYRDQTYPVTNIGEANCGTHLIRPNTIVEIWGKPDLSDPPVTRWFMNTGDEGTCGSPPCNQSSSSSSSSSSAYACIYRFDAKYHCDIGQWQFVRNSHGNVEIGVICELPTNPLYMPQGSWIVNPGATDCSAHYYMLGPSCPAHEITAGCPIPALDDYPAYPASPPSSCCPPSSSSPASSSSSAASSSSSSSGGPAPCTCSDENYAIPTVTVHVNGFDVDLTNTMDPSHKCTWNIANANVDNPVYPCSPTASLTLFLNISGGCIWTMQFSNGSGGQDLYEKTTGDDPSGTYTRNHAFPVCGGLPDTIDVDL